MKKSLFPVLFACVLLVALALVSPHAAQSSPDPLSIAWNNLRAASLAEQSVQRAWLLAQVSGSYNFHTELEQTTYYAPALTNVGRPVQVDSLYLEGQTDVKNQTLQLALWQGGSVLRPADALEMRVENGKAYGRAAGGAWQEVDTDASAFSGVFAPAHDPLAFLHGARDMSEVTPPGASYRQFSFAADGPAFAQYIRGQLEDELRRAGKLPANITLDTARVYRDMLGAGNLWLTADGLPQRLEMDIEFPQQSDGSRVKASIRSDFSNFAQVQASAYDKTPLMGALMGRNTPLWLSNLAARLWLINWAEAAGQCALACVLGAFMLTMMMLRRRWAYAALSIVIIFTMLFSPLIDSQRAYAFSQEQAAAQQKRETERAQQQAQRDLEARLLNAWDPTQDPLAAAEARAALAQATPDAPAQQQSVAPLTLTSLQNPVGAQAAAAAGDSTDTDNDGVPDSEEPASCRTKTTGAEKLDCDGDGLTDLQEYRLGARLDEQDSDGDGLRDDMEVRGFGSTTRTFAGKWYSDPNSVDTNMDGLPDNMECWTDNTFAFIKNSLPSNMPCDRDSDGDGVPDMFDEDNDNDGVDDIRDLSPFNVSFDTYDNGRPFFLQVNGLTPNEPLFVDIQLAPTSRNQVGYARNVLDWPSGDTQGQVQRSTDSTFADFMSAEQRQADPSAANGDMRLVPLVEIKIPAADAGNLLPRTQSVTTRRSAIGYDQVTSGSGENAETEFQVWLRAEIEFRARNGGTTLAFTSLQDNAGANITVDRVKLFNTPSCPVSPNATPQYQKTTATATGDTWVPASYVPLPSLLDGNHVIMLEQGSGDALKTACLPLGDVPNGGLSTGWMFDSAKLDAYGVNLRDVVDTNKATTHVAAYAPANVVVGRTGGEKQAFAARMPYWPGHVTGLGEAQEVRLIWMVQLQDDDGRIQIVHTYPNESWKLAGLSARQDMAMRSAVLYQNPDYAGATSQDKLVHSYIWKAAQVLGSRFAIDRVGKTRLALDGQLVANLQNTFRFPAGSLGVVQTTYETQDEVARIPKEVTYDTVLPRFITGGAMKAGFTHALLLFAREEDYKSAVWSGGDLTLPAASSTLASYNWKPFRYTSNGWEPYPVQDYLDLVGVAMDDVIKAGWTGMPNLGPDPATARSGMVLADQMFALGMFYGGNQMVNVQGALVECSDEEGDDIVSTIGDDVVGAVLGFVADELLEDFVDNFTVQAGQTTAAGWTGLGDALKGKFTEGLDEPGAFSKVKAGAAIGLTVASYAVSAAALGLAIASLAGADTEAAANIVEHISTTLDVISSVAGMVSTVQDTLKAVRDAGSLLKAVQSSTNAVSKAAVIAAVVGLVITIGIAVGIFITQWAMGAFSITDLAFTAALAAMVAGIIVTVILFAIGLIPIVGPIIVAVIALIDAVINAICAVSKAAGYDMEEEWSTEVPGGSGAELSFCAGINGFLTTAVQWTIFSQNVLVGNMYDADRLKTGNFMLGMVNANQGFQVGNAIKPKMRVDNRIELIDQPIDWKSAFYFWQINWDILDDTTHRYDLTVDESERSVDMSEMESEWQELDNGRLTGGHLSPGVQYDDPLHMVPATAQLAQGLDPVRFDQAGINAPIALYLREAYANPTQECFWIPPFPPFFIFLPPVCYIRDDSGANHIDLKLAFDIFPATLDEFYAPFAKDGGYSLAWGQTGEVTFPAMADFDGDGLRSPAFGGNDPDDSKWDADGDGLSDLFELEHGSSPTLTDSDNDGLTDRQELIGSSHPNQADSDGDGLLDCEETFHQVLAADQYGRCGSVTQPPVWRGGWEFVYDLTGGVPAKTWVSSDPQQLDGDGDALTDYQEKLYGLHPLVKSDPTILKLESQVREAGAPAMLLRLEERAGANLFGDTSGLLNNATCTGAGCPTAGHEGRYTNGLVFDGVDDQVVIADSPSLRLDRFTLSLWVNPAQTKPDYQPLLVKSDANSNNRNYALMLTPGTTQVRASFNLASCSVYDLAYVESNASLPLNAWSHVAFTYDGANLMLYINGTVDKTMPWTGGLCQRPNAVRLGRLESVYTAFNGRLDEAAIFPTALNATQVQAVRDARYNPGGAQVVVKPGDALTYDATLTNNLLGKQLTGLLDVQAPAGWSKQVAPVTYRLGPAGTQTLQGSVTAAGASGAYSLTLTAGAAASDPAVAPPPPPSPPPAFAPPAGYWGKWAFDGDYADSSGYARHGAPGGENALPSLETGFKNKSIDLNPDYKNHVTLPPGVANTADFTFAAWVYFRGGTEWQRVFDFGVDQGNYMVLTPWDNDGNYRFQIRDNWGSEQWVSTNGFGFPHNTWVHVAVTLGGNTARLYVNGVEKANGTITYDPWQIYGSTSWLGKSHYHDSEYLNGKLDEVFVYHRPLSAAEIQQLALSGVTDVTNFEATDAMVYLPFDNHYLDYNSYNDWRSPQGNAIPGRIPADLTSPFFGPGVNSAALNLNGDGSYVTLPGNVANTGEFTFAAWVYWRGGGNWQRIFDFGQDTNKYIMLSPNGDGSMQFWITTSSHDGAQKLATTPLPINTWVHVAVTLDGNTGRIYVNGVEHANNPNMTLNPNQVWGNNTWLGKSQYPDPYFNGLLDEVRIYHRAFSAAELLGLAQEGMTDAVQFTFDNASARLAYTSKNSANVRAGTATYAAGIGGGQALDLNGQTALEASSPVFNMSNTDFTYAMWVKPDANASGVQAVWGQPPTERDWRETSQGIYLLVRNGTDVKFAWGGPTSWPPSGVPEWYNGKLIRGAWNHVAVTFNAGTVALYVNGDNVFRQSTQARPPARYTLSIGAENPCAEFELKNVYTVYSSMFRVFLYDFVDDLGNKFRMEQDESADRGDWEPGSGPTHGEWFTDRKYVFCGAAKVNVWSPSSPLGPTTFLGLNTPEKTGYGRSNYNDFSSGDISGNGAARYFYEIHRSSVAFVGLLDDFRMVRRAMTEEEVQLLYAAGALPYHFTLDDPPGAGLNANQFNFKNQGAVANAQVKGTCAPGACPTSGLPGRINQAVQFQGNQSLQIANLDLPAAAPGFSLWVNPSDSPTLEAQVFKLETRYSIAVQRSENKFCISTDFSNQCSDSIYLPGQWYHLMLIFSNGAKLYVNGQKAIDTFAQWRGAGQYNVILGGGFSGLLDDLRIPYDGSVAAVDRMMKTAPTVLLHLQESGAGVTGFTNLGGALATCSGAACPEAGVKGKVSHAARFDGIDDWLSIPDSAALDLNRFSLMAWVKPTAGQNVPGMMQMLVVKATTTSRNYTLYLTNDRKINSTLFCGGQYLEELVSSRSLPLDQYTHVAVTYNGNRWVLYINGVVDTSRTLSVNTCPNDAPLIIGRSFSGDLDEIQLYNYALYTYQVKDIFELQANWIEEENSYDVLVDADNPTSNLAGALPNPTTYYANKDVQLGIKAQDPTSAVAMLELGLGRNGGAITWTAAEACQDASGGTAAGSPAWCPWFKPTTLGGEGRYTLQTRATDAVGNRETPAAGRTILVDATGPTLTAAQADGSLQALQPHPTQANAQVLALNGQALDPNLSSGDAGSGVAAVQVTLRDADGQVVGDAPYPAQLNGANWTLNYPFWQAKVAGPYFLQVTASDKVGNSTALPARTLYLDGTAPGVTLDETASGLPQDRYGTFVRDTTTLRGVISERPFLPGAQAVYPFEENAGATSFANAVASSGWQNPGHATCSGATCPTAGGAGQAGKGLNLDGVDDYVTLPQSVGQAQDFTFAAWVYWRGESAFQRILDFGRDTSYNMFLTPSSGAVMRFAIKNDGPEQQLDAPAPLSTNAWTHVAVTLQGDTARLYLNGVKVNERTITLNPSQVAGPNNWLGKSQYPDPYFNGQLDEVAIYARALSADEIRVLAAPQVSGLQAAAVSFTPLWADTSSGAFSPHLSQYLDGQTLYLPLDDARDKDQNITFRNLARPAMPANCQGAYCPEPGERSPVGPAVSFDGRDDYIDLPWDTWRDNFSFAAWVYWRGGSNYSMRLLDGRRSTSSVTLYVVSNGQPSFEVYYNNQYQTLWGPALPKDTWVHLALSLQDTNCVLYLNGNQVAQGAITHSLSQAAASWAMLGNLFNGQMSDVRTFSRGLSAAEVQSLWRGTRALLALPLDEPFVIGGSTLPDASGWKNTATFNAGAGDAANKAAPGISGPYALAFDGVNDYARTPEKATLANNSFSVALWAKRANTSSDEQYVFSSGTEQTNRGLSIGFNNNRFRCSFQDNTLLTTALYDDTDWHHWACTYDASTRQRTIYRDGVPVAQDIALAHYQGSGDWYIGARPSYMSYFSGALDDVRVYPRSLAAAEVADLANAGWRAVSLSGEQANWSLPVPAGLEGAYRLDLRGVDAANPQHYSFNSQKATPIQTIDSLPPRVTLTRSKDAWGNYFYRFVAQDLHLSKTGLSTPCGSDYFDETERLDPATGKYVLSKLTIGCIRYQTPPDERATVCDTAGNCTTVNPTLAALGSQAVAGQPIEPPLARLASLPANEPVPALQPASSAPNPPLARLAASSVAAGVMPIRWNGDLWQNDTAPRLTAPGSSIAAPLAGETCFATPNDGTTVYSSTNASAVRAALAAVSPGDTVKVAGYCPGVQASGGTTQTVIISQSVTLAGGYTTTNWTTPDPLAYPTILDADGGGRVIYASAAATLTHLTIQNGASDDHGGGAYFAYVPATVSGVTFISNTAVNNGGGAALFDTAIISNVTFTGNSSGGFGGGMYVLSAADVDGSSFISNSAALNGGGASFNGATSVAGVTFAGNTAIGQYGGGAAFHNSATVTNTTFTDNASAAFYGGGGAYFSGAYPRQLTNILFARNQSNHGAAVFVADAAPFRLVHATIASLAQTAGEAVYVEGGTVYLTNTIVASHTTGIANPFGAIATAWNPLFFGNTADTTGDVTVNDAVTGDPAFVNPSADDYHLTAVSAAINAGITPIPDVTRDIDGDARPQQGGYDIGYDETPFNTPPVITPSAGAGGSITPDTPQRIAYGSSITFTIMPEVGYIIADVGVDGVSQGAVSSYTFVNVQADHTITAAFTAGGVITPGTLEFIDLPVVMTTLTPVQIKGRVAPPNSLTELTVAIDATPILTESYPPGTVLSELFQADWLPLQAGAYLLTAQATDALSGTATISASLFVDTTPPQAALEDSGVYTSAQYAPHTGLTFNGVASDTTGIVSATAYLDLGSGLTPLSVAFDQAAVLVGYLNGQAVYSRTAWSATWWELDNLPDNVAGTLYLVLDDVTLVPVTFTFPVTLDVVPPDWGNVVITANGVPITTGWTYTGSLLDTAVYISPTTDGAPVSLWYGWTESYTTTLADLTPAVDPSVAITLTQSFTRSVAEGGTARFFHLQAVDALGNTRAAVLGPYYHDLPGMPDYIPEMGGGYGRVETRPYRAWQDNGCTLLGIDQRIPDQGLPGAALSSDQSFYLTWNDDWLHFVWQGADWETDGDLFIYLDTLPDQASPYQQVGGGAAYNPYTSTNSSTVMLLPVREWSNNPNFVPPAGAPAVNGMHADYALWVKDRTSAHLLRWDNTGQQWADDGNLNELGGAYALDTSVDGTFTDLIVPLDLVGNPQNWAAPFPSLGPEGMGVVALAVDAQEGVGSGLPGGGGLRIWSVLPYANPADSARVVPNAPAADQPHLVMLTERYVVPVADGACFPPEAELEFYLTADVDRFAYDGLADDIRLILPAPSVNPDAWDGLFDPYDDVFRAWLSAEYCPAHPTYPACRAAKPPAELSIAELLAGLIESQHPPLLPGDAVTYTLYYVNPAETLTTTTAFLYTNGDLNDPQSGVVFDASWVGGCPGWLALELQSGAGWLVFTGTVQAAGVSTVTLDITPSYSMGAGCAIVPGDGSWPEYRLTVQHTPDDGAPAFTAIRPDFTVAGPVSATIPGVVADASPVGALQIQVNGAFTFACLDDTPTDGQWQCLWDIPASNGGNVPANGDEFTLRARATDAFGNVSAWSEPQAVLIDTQSPQFEGGSGLLRAKDYLSLAAQAAATPTLLSDLVIYLGGGISDNTVPQSVELCDAAGQNCAAASLALDPFSIPPTAYSYADVLTTPVPIDINAACGAGTLGLARAFSITDSFTIGGLQAGLRLAHPYRSDLSARLRSPAGTEVTLFSFNKNVLAENVNARFTNQALARLTDDLFSHDLEAGFDARAFRPQDSLSAFEGENAAGTWTLTLCDRDPANDTGAFYAAALDFAAVAPPLNVSGSWSYNFDASGSDGALYTWQLFAVDIHGNRTAQPYSLTVQVDNVAPVITATQTVTQALIPNGAQILHGTASDGNAVSNIWVLVTDPLGNVWSDSVQGDAAAWTYTFTPTLGGEYQFAVYAADRAGNQAGVGMFNLTALQPLDLRQAVTPEYNVEAGSLVTYTLWAANYNADETAENVVITSTLNPWLTPVDTAGAAYIEALPDNLLVWPARTLAAGDAISFTVLARMPDELLFTTTMLITPTQIITNWVDLRGALFTSQASLSTDNLGASEAYQISFIAEGVPEAPPAPLVEIGKQVTPMLDVPRGSVVTYTIHVTNSTDITAENVIVSDTLHVALTPEDLGGAMYNSATRTLTWPARALEPGESATLTFSARLATDQGLLDSLFGYIENQAVVSSSLGSGLSNIAVLYARVTQRIYLPLVLRSWPPQATPMTEPVPAIPSQPVTTPGATFYTTTLVLNTAIPEEGYFYFSSAPTSLQPVSVDDQIVLVHEGVEIYSELAIPPVILEVPRAVVETIAAGGVILEYRDMYGDQVGASPVWLVWSAVRP